MPVKRLSIDKSRRFNRHKLQSLKKISGIHTPLSTVRAPLYSRNLDSSVTNGVKINAPAGFPVGASILDSQAKGQFINR